MGASITMERRANEVSEGNTVLFAQANVAAVHRVTALAATCLQKRTARRAPAMKEIAEWPKIYVSHRLCSAAVSFSLGPS